MSPEARAGTGRRAPSSMVTRRDTIRIWLLTLLYLVFGPAALEGLDPDEVELLVGRIDRRLGRASLSTTSDATLKEQFRLRGYYNHACFDAALLFSAMPPTPEERALVADYYKRFE